MCRLNMIVLKRKRQIHTLNKVLKECFLFIEIQFQCDIFRSCVHVADNKVPFEMNDGRFRIIFFFTCLMGIQVRDAIRLWMTRKKQFRNDNEYPHGKIFFRSTLMLKYGRGIL